MDNNQYIEEHNQIKELEARNKFYEELARSEEDKQKGRYKSIDKVFEQLRETIRLSSR